MGASEHAPGGQVAIGSEHPSQHSVVGSAHSVRHHRYPRTNRELEQQNRRCIQPSGAKLRYSGPSVRVASRHSYSRPYSAWHSSLGGGSDEGDTDNEADDGWIDMRGNHRRSLAVDVLSPVRPLLGLAPPR